MKEVVSANIGEKKIIQYKGKEILTGIYKMPIKAPINLGFTDVMGDDVIDRKYHGGIDKACYLYSSDHYSFWKQKYPNVEWDWGMFGENLSISDLDESKIFIGDIFQLGTAKVQVTQPRQPCYKLGIRLNNPNAVKAFVEAEKPGVYIRVLEDGKVRKGDRMELLVGANHDFSIQRIFHLIYQAPENIALVKQAIEVPELAESCRNDLIKYAKL